MGRPKGSKNKPKIVENDVPKRRGRPPGSKNKTKVMDEQVIENRDGNDVPKRRGRPPGSKNKTKDVVSPVKVDVVTPIIKEIEPDEGLPIYEYHHVHFDESLSKIGCGWRYVMVEDAGKGSLKLTETTGDIHKVNKLVFGILPKGKIVRSNRPPGKEI